MILEVVLLDIKETMDKEFEQSFSIAQEILSSIDGYISHQLQKCIEKENRYILLVQWETLQAHTVNFRESKQYLEWKELLHHYYSPFPDVEHFSVVFDNTA